MKNLKDLKIWLCWNFASRAGKVTKVPISATGGTTGTSNEYEETWVTYDEAIAAARENGYDGVGFIITPGVFFIDIDHCDISDPFVQSILKCVPTYAECSVSGEGIHIYGKCDPAMIPTYIDKDGASHLSRVFYQKNPNNGVEIYFGDLTNRYAVFTGNVIQDRDIVDCTDGVLKVLDMAMRRPDRQDAVPKSEPLAAPPVAADTDEVIAGLRKQKNASKFEQLFDRGDIAGFKSQSEADVSLCAIIAFRAGPDPDAIDAVFRQSALYREKWERDDYRNATINAGIGACGGEFYRPPKSKPDKNGKAASYKERPFFVITDDKGKMTVSPALLADYFKQRATYIRVRDNATQGVLTYIYKDGVYQLVSDDIIMGYLKQFVADYKKILVRKAQITEALFNINTDLDFVSQEALNANENIINFQNGLLYITAAGVELKSHTPDVLSTVQLPCKWIENPPETPVFDQFMNTLTDGNKDVKQLLMEFIGVCLSNVKGHRTKKSLFLYGPGDTGKSKLLELVQRILGKGNFTGIDLAEIEARFGTSSIYGKRLVGSADMNYMSIKELKTFKKLTGGDSVFAEFKGKDSFEFTFTGLLWFCMNELPRFGGDDGEWVYERIMPVYCPNVIPKEEQDKTLTDRMMAEAEGIVHKAVMALCTVIANGYRFSEPSSVAEARKAYAADNNTVITFFRECMCEVIEGHPDRTYSIQDIYDIYKIWCRRNNNGFPKTLREFQKDVTRYLGAQSYNDITEKINGHIYLKNHQLLPSAIDNYGHDLTRF